MTVSFRSGFWVVVLTGAALLAGQADTSPESQLSGRRLESELRFLASDELGGRATGSTGADSAARFIAESFREAGLRPAPGLSSFLQQVSFQRRSSPAKISLTIQKESFDNRKLAWLSGDAAEIEAQGVVAVSWRPELKGQIWLSPLTLSGGVSVLQATITEKILQASEGGARALIHIFSGESGWDQMRDFLTRPQTLLKEPGAPKIPHLILATQATFPDRLAKINLHSTQVGVENFTSSNVVGIIEGSDSDLRKEFIGLVAHYDHLGPRKLKDPAPGQDVIFNGARDNGMGVVALLGAARALSESRPQRSILLLAVTGEELGLLGSRYFVENPTVPLEQIRFVLNVDGAGFTDTDIVTVIGLDRTNGKGLLEEAASDFGLETLPEPQEAASLFARSDNYNFALKGVPAITFSPGFREMNQTLMRHYHQTSDEADDDFDYDYLVKFVRIFARAARYLADSEEPLAWTAGDPFATKGRALYGLP